MLRFVVSDILTDDAALIRREVFMDEQGFVNEFDETDDVSRHIVAYDGDSPVAVCRITPGEDGVCHLGRVAVVSDHRGRSLGSILLREAEVQASDIGQRRMVLGAQVRAKGFYERQGYVAYGEEYMDEWCPHIMMGKDLRSHRRVGRGTPPS